MIPPRSAASSSEGAGRAWRVQPGWPSTVPTAAALFSRLPLSWVLMLKTLLVVKLWESFWFQNVPFFYYINTRKKKPSSHGPWEVGASPSCGKSCLCEEGNATSRPGELEALGSHSGFSQTRPGTDIPIEFKIPLSTLVLIDTWSLETWKWKHKGDRLLVTLEPGAAPVPPVRDAEFSKRACKKQLWFIN